MSLCDSPLSRLASICTHLLIPPTGNNVTLHGLKLDVIPPVPRKSYCVFHIWSWMPEFPSLLTVRIRPWITFCVSARSPGGFWPELPEPRELWPPGHTAHCIFPTAVHLRLRSVMFFPRPRPKPSAVCCPQQEHASSCSSQVQDFSSPR